LDVSAPWNRRGREVQSLSDPVSTSAPATALADLDDLVLVAQPGMGNTTTLFQIAEAVLANANALPIVIPLADWSADGASLLESITLFADLFFGRTLGRLGTSLLPWWCAMTRTLENEPDYVLMHIGQRRDG
jgi:hypothetical protein